MAAPRTSLLHLIGELTGQILEGVRRVMREEFGISRPRLVDGDEVARMLGVKRRTVETLKATGDLPVLYVRGAPRYDVAAVEAYIRSLPNKRSLPTKPKAKRGPRARS